MSSWSRSCSPFFDRENDRSGGSSASNDALLVVSTISEDRIDLERKLFDTIEDAPDRVGRVLVARDWRNSECERLLGIEDECGTVAVTVGSAVTGLHRTDLAWMVEIRPVIGIIDEIDDHDPRPLGVEDRGGVFGEEVVNDGFERV